MGTRNIISTDLAGGEIHIFGFVLMNEIIGNYALRMAGIYMTAIGALWSRTGLMPRWLTLITYIPAVGFIFAAIQFREARFIFPTWVLVVSIGILISKYRGTHENGDISEV